jgi:hypothetical protein
MSRSKGLTGPRRQRGLVGIVVAVAVAVVAMLVATGAGAVDPPTPTIPDNTYLFGPHQGADSTTFNHEGDCSVEGSEVLWHFVLPQTVAENGGRLEAFFQSAGQIGPVSMTKHVGGVIHWDVITPTDDVLVDAWTEATSAAPAQPSDADPPRQIRLSHVCGGGGGTQFDASLATNVHDADHNDITNTSVPLGTAIHDLTTVTPVAGTTISSGEVHFTLYTGLDCGSSTGELKDNVDVALGTDNAGGEPNFSSLQATTTPRTLGAGDYSYGVTADLTTSANTSLFVTADECEPFTVKKSDLSMDSLIHDSSHTANTSFPLGSVVHDTGKITAGAVGGFGTEPITFKFYANKTCYGDGTAVSNTGADGGDATRDRSADSAALGAGDYSYKAFVAGNANYIGADSGCEPFTVNKGDLAIRTDIHNAAHQVITSADAGAIVHDTATLSGAASGFNPDLTKISFRFYANGTCYGTGTSVTNIGSESTYVARSAASAALAMGDFSYKASFAGDGNYNPAGPATCEPLHIFNGALTIGYWGNHLAKSGTSGCSSAPNGTGCSSSGPFTADKLGKTICVDPVTCPNGITSGNLGNTTITTFLQAATVFKNNNCSNASSSDSNAAACLAAQLLGAELNIANGANTCACATIKSAIALLKAVNYNPTTNTSTFTGSGYTRQNAIDLKTKLDNYNNAKGCPV